MPVLPTQENREMKHLRQSYRNPPPCTLCTCFNPTKTVSRLARKGWSWLQVAVKSRGQSRANYVPVLPIRARIRKVCAADNHNRILTLLQIRAEKGVVEGARHIFNKGGQCQGKVYAGVADSYRSENDTAVRQAIP